MNIHFMTAKLVRLALILQFMFAGNPLFSKQKKEECPIHIRYAHELTNSITPILEKEFDLHCCGGGGGMATKIEQVALRFTANRRATIPEARQLLVRCIERVREEFNKCEKVRPYLAEYPFPANRVSISVSFDSEYYGRYSDNTVCHLFAAKGNIFYYLSDPIRDRSAEMFIEPYEEALKIVTQSKLPDSACRQHAKKPYEDDLDRFFYSFTKEANKKYGILCKRPGGDMRDGIKRFDFLFVKKKRANLEEARNIEMGLTQLLIDKINADEKLRPYLANYPFRVDQTRIRVEFREKGLYKFRDGSLYSVTRETDNQIVYDKWDPPDGCWLPSHPTPVKKESYEEAQAALLVCKKKR